jgi:5-methylcytosine-specific restriction endonuclease McrA
VIRRSGNCCEYCQISQDDIFFAFEIDHIVAEKHGGATDAENLCLSCPDCNAFKGSDIASVDWADKATIVRLFHPRRDTWKDHFSLNGTPGVIQGQTAVGRVTVNLLRFNDADRIMDRKLLLDAERYPCISQRKQ